MDDIYKNDEYWNIGLSDDVHEIIMRNKDRLNLAINYENDYNLDYFGFKVIDYFYILSKTLLYHCVYMIFRT